MTTVLATVLVLAITGLIFGAILAYASRVFQVEVDPKVEEIQKALPGANCGACGYPGCSGYAQAVAAGTAKVDVCTPGGAPVAEKLASIMGVEAGDVEAQVAFVQCGGKECKERFEYQGIRQCLAAQQLGGGHKACTWACLGFGDCVEVCAFGALSMGPDGLPQVAEELCTGCGLCTDACPRDVIAMIPAGAKVRVACGSRDRGSVVRKICPDGCIGCGICAKACPHSAIEMVDNLAVINYEKCDGCGTCAQKCPTGAIVEQEQ
jgi:electron transport complex protein RnfB